VDQIKYLSTNKDLFYKETGKVDIRRLILTLPILIGVESLLSYIYIYFSLYSPTYFLNIVFFIVYCLALGFFSIWLAAEFCKSRNRIISIFIGFTVGAIALYLSWAIYIQAIWEEFVMLRPYAIWTAISPTAEDPSDFIVWVIEAIGIVLTPVVFMYYFATRTVYCEKCNKWAFEETGILGVSHLCYVESNKSGGG
jgi:hypothetical protein